MWGLVMVTLQEKIVKTVNVSRNKRKNRAKLESEIVILWLKGYSVSKIAEIVGCRNATPREVIAKKFGEKALDNRKTKAYRKSKEGNRNPMKGLKTSEHPNYTCVSSDCKGYLTMVRPDWYEGTEKRIFVHRAVWAFWYGFNRVPDNLIIHHIDQNPLNNRITNLVAMTNSDHIKLHWILEGVKTIPEGSTTKWLEAQSIFDKDDEIVCS